MSIKGVVVNVLRKQDQATQFLYLRRSGGPFVGQWWPITGTPKTDELPIETAIREMKEETGLTPISIYDLGVRVPHADGHSTLSGYVAFTAPNAEVHLNYEHNEFRWLNVEQVLQTIHPMAHSIIKHIDSNFIKSHSITQSRVWPS